MTSDTEHLAGILSALRVLIAVALLFLAESAARVVKTAKANGNFATEYVFAVFAAVCLVGACYATAWAIAV